ncbi:MAG: hypothetical protein JXL97_18225 [Bacteroidales bacterium]|nr:hypothetical protein [Bacteroidales bacterium]
MKQFDYIDKIISKSIGDMKVPVDKNWNEMNNILNNLPKAEIPVSTGFFSTIAGKVISVITAITTVTTAVLLLINPFDKQTESNTIQKPVDIKIEIISNRQAVMIEADFDNQDNIIVENNSNNIVENIVEKDTTEATQITIIHVEQTTIDTLNSND